MANFRLGKRVTLISFTKPKIYYKSGQNKTKTRCGHNDLPYTLLIEALPLHCSRTTFIMKLYGN